MVRFLIGVIFILMFGILGYIGLQPFLSTQGEIELLEARSQYQQDVDQGEITKQQYQANVDIIQANAETQREIARSQQAAAEAMAKGVAEIAAAARWQSMTGLIIVVAILGAILFISYMQHSQNMQMIQQVGKQPVVNVLPPSASSSMLADNRASISLPQGTSTELTVVKVEEGKYHVV
jgi:competence protein ComGC